MDLIELPEDNPMMKLSNQHREFLMHYVENGYNHNKAGKEVGIAVGRAIWVTKNQDFKDAIMWYQNQEQNDLTVSKQFVIDGYKEVIELAKDKDDLTALNRAYDSVAKLMGYNQPTKTEHSHSGTITHTREFVEEQLEKRLSKMQQDSITVEATSEPEDTSTTT